MEKKRITVFTLLELLIVISVIIILVSILLPAFSKAKATALKIQCGNKMKQIGTQIYMYCDDSNSSLPIFGEKYRVPIASITVYWCNYISYYYFNDIVWHTLSKPSVHFSCPTDKSPYPYQGTINSYGFNAFIMPEVYAGKKMRLQDFTSPSMTYMLSDSNWFARHAIGMDPPLVLRLEHNKSTNMIYMDGHMSPISSQPPALSSNVPWYYK